MTQQQQQTQTEETQEFKYFIDPQRSKELGRSLETMLLSRRCASCRIELSRQPEPPPAEQQIKDIAQCCSTAEDFIRPEMPLLEIVFRTLLAAGNRPHTLEELHYAVTERWATPTNPRSLSAKDLRRILVRDRFYGFREVEEQSQ